RNPRRLVALERSQCPRLYRSLGNRNTIAVQTTFDASFPARPNQFVFPFGPFLVGNLPLSSHRGHLDNLAATVEGALSLAVPCCRSGGSLPRSSYLPEQAFEDANAGTRLARGAGPVQQLLSAISAIGFG